MKKNLAFLLGITPNLAFAAGNVALSLQRRMTHTDYEVVIYHTGLNPADAAAFQHIRNVRLVPFRFPEPFLRTLLTKSPPESRFRQPNQLMTFCHFEAFELLEQYRNVVWLDADISVQASLADITQFGPFAMTVDAPWPVQNNFTAPIPGFDMAIAGLCAAVMLVNEALPYKAMYKWCYYKAAEYANYLTNGDQGVINLLCQAFRVAPRLMPLETWQCISWRGEARSAKVVHFGAEKKVWLDPHVFRAFPEWYRVHLEWLKLGGSDFDQSKVRLTGFTAA